MLAFSGGPLHREFAAVAGRVVVASLPLDQAAVLAHDYDVVHILTERCAHRVAPMALAASDAALVYGKTYDGPAIARMQGVFDHGADESLLSASDAVTFTTLDLAAGYRLPPGRTTILRKAAAIAAALDMPPITSDLPLRILTIANLHPRKRLADLIPVMRQVRQRVPRAELRVVGGGPESRMKELRDAHRGRRIVGRDYARGIAITDRARTRDGARRSRCPPSPKACRPSCSKRWPRRVRWWRCAWATSVMC